MSLATLELATKDLHCGREAMRVDRKADRNTYGAILDAIVAVRRLNGCLGVESLCGDGALTIEFDVIGEASFQGTLNHDSVKIRTPRHLAVYSMRIPASTAKSTISTERL